MPDFRFKMSQQAEDALKKKIAEQVGARARTIVTALHQKILDNTPMNTGRTLGSWFGSAGTAVVFDIADRVGGPMAYRYHLGLAHTNHEPVGEEPTDRQFFENYALSSTESIKFEANPYQIFYIANGAKLDSGNGLSEATGGNFKGLTSSLPEGAGSRALMQEYGVIADFDLFASSGGHSFSTFTPRGTNAVGLAVASIRLTYGR